MWSTCMNNNNNNNNNNQSLIYAHIYIRPTAQEQKKSVQVQRNRLKRAERMMVYEVCACGVSLNDRKRSDELLSRLGIDCVEEKIQRA